MEGGSVSGRYAAETKEGFPAMTDGTTTMSMLEEHELFTIEKLLDEYVDADNTIPAIAWRRLLSDYRTLQSRLEQQHWDAISRDQTIENLRAKYDRLRDILDWGLTETHAFYPGQELHSYRSRWQRVMAQAGEAIYGWPQDEYYGVWNKANDEHDQLYTVVPLTEHNQTIETLRAENARLRAENTVLRSALNWALEDGGWQLWYYGWDMPDTIKAGLIGNHAEIDEEALERAVAAIIEGKEVTS